jgi:hypothetical protein
LTEIPLRTSINKLRNGVPILHQNQYERIVSSGYVSIAELNLLDEFSEDVVQDMCGNDMELLIRYVTSVRRKMRLGLSWLSFALGIRCSYLDGRSLLRSISLKCSSRVLQDDIYSTYVFTVG